MAGLDANTKFLSHWNGPDGAKEIVDDGATGHIVTQVATAQTSTAQKKIGNCSLLLDGDSDWLTVPDHADWDLGAGAWSMECFARFNGATWNVVTPFMSFYNGNTGDGIRIGYDDADLLRVIIQGTMYDWTWNPAGNTWYHIAVVRRANTLIAFIDGVLLTDPQSSFDITGASVACNNLLYIGVNEANNTRWMKGWIDEIRISNVDRSNSGTSFTVPTAAYTSDANTKLLLHMESHNIAGSYDPSTFVGTAQLDTAIKKWTASLLLDGDSDYVTFPDNANWNFGTGQLTVDAWVYFTALPADGLDCYIARQWTGSKAWGFSVNNTSGTYKLRWTASVDGSALTDNITWNSSGLSTGQWYHFAVTRDASNLRVFQDGVQQGSDTANTTNIFNSTAVLEVGGRSGGEFINGWLEELRISDVARWTANFTPPTAEYSSQAGPAGAKKIEGVALASVKKVSGVAIASVKKIIGVV